MSKDSASKYIYSTDLEEAVSAFQCIRGKDFNNLDMRCPTNMIFLITRSDIKTELPRWVVEIYIKELMCEKKETILI